MSEILNYEDLKEITNRTSARSTKAQVIADLTNMGLKFKLNARGYPISSATAYNRFLGIKTSAQPAEPAARNIQVG